MRAPIFCLALCALLSFPLSLHAQSTKPKTVAVIPKGTTHEFWKSIHAGAIKAQQEWEAQGVPVRIIWKGPLREDDREQQIQVVENFIGRKVDGIILAPLDADALKAPVNQAVKRKIPVVIIDSALNSEDPASFVATNNFEGGRMGGDHLAKLLDGKGKVLLLRYQVGSASTEQREAGFLEALKAHPGITVVSSDQYAGATRDTALRAAQNLLNRHGREIQAVFTPNESSTVGMNLALKEASLAGKVLHVGFDTSPVLIDAVKAGQIQGLVAQDPFQMGYLGMQQMINILSGRPVMPKFDTPVRLVTKENLGDQAIKDLINPPLDKYLR
jgi:ribose transport system substrate-binding protein